MTAVWEQFTRFVAQGGWPLLAIFVASACGLTMAWTIRGRLRLESQSARSPQWKACVKNSETAAADAYVSEDVSRLGGLTRLALRLAHRGEQDIVRRTAAERRHREEELGRGLGLLGALAAITPLLGLTGTVFGMITSFEALGDSRRPLALSAGIEQALVTTQAGLVFGVPLILCRGWLMSRFERSLRDAELRVRHIEALFVAEEGVR